ncbi:hypothetical protein ACK3YH_20720, partial [Aeromonas caviae]
QKTENRKQKTENRKQKTENRKQKTENRNVTSVKMWLYSPCRAENLKGVFAREGANKSYGTRAFTGNPLILND